MPAADDWYAAGILVHPPSELTRCEMNVNDVLKNADIPNAIAQPLCALIERLDAQNKRIATLELKLRLLNASSIRTSHDQPPPLDRAELAKKLEHELHEGFDYSHADPEHYDVKGCEICKENAERIIEFFKQEGALRQ